MKEPEENHTPLNTSVVHQHDFCLQEIGHPRRDRCPCSWSSRLRMYSFIVHFQRLRALQIRELQILKARDFSVGKACTDVNLGGNCYKINIPGLPSGCLNVHAANDNVITSIKVDPDVSCSFFLCVCLSSLQIVIFIVLLGTRIVEEETLPLHLIQQIILEEPSSTTRFPPFPVSVRPSPRTLPL